MHYTRGKKLNWQECPADDKYQHRWLVKHLHPDGDLPASLASRDCFRTKEKPLPTCEAHRTIQDMGRVLRAATSGMARWLVHNINQHMYSGIYGCTNLGVAFAAFLLLPGLAVCMLVLMMYMSSNFCSKMWVYSLRLYGTARHHIPRLGPVAGVTTVVRRHPCKRWPMLDAARRRNSDAVSMGVTIKKGWEKVIPRLRFHLQGQTITKHM